MHFWHWFHKFARGVQWSMSYPSIRYASLICASLIEQSVNRQMPTQQLSFQSSNMSKKSFIQSLSFLCKLSSVSSSFLSDEPNVSPSMLSSDVWAEQSSSVARVFGARFLPRLSHPSSTDDRLGRKLLFRSWRWKSLKKKPFKYNGKETF